jgi:hypothetical protein
LNDTEQNPDANGTPVVVWNSPGTDETTMRIPNPDPGELWTLGELEDHGERGLV